MADFRIESVPHHISFTCPHCESDVEIPWRQANPPQSWSDQWDDVKCPECGEMVTLEDWEYD